MPKNSDFNFSAPCTIEDLTLAYQGHNVVENLSLSLTKGEIFGLVGLNGAGKTSMIKTMLALMTPVRGSVYFFGIESYKKEARQHVAFLPEKFQPSPYLTCFEFIHIAASLHHKKFARKDIITLADRFGLHEKDLEKKIKQLSKGMGQKIGLILMFLLAPPLLILDEPMSGLDPISRIILKEEMRLFQARGNTIFFTSHMLADVEEICHRMAVLHGKHCAFLGAAQALKDKFSTPHLEKAFLALVDLLPEKVS